MVQVNDAVLGTFTLSFWEFLQSNGLRYSSHRMSINFWFGEVEDIFRKAEEREKDFYGWGDESLIGDMSW